MEIVKLNIGKVISTATIKNRALRTSSGFTRPFIKVRPIRGCKHYEHLNTTNGKRTLEMLSGTHAHSMQIDLSTEKSASIQESDQKHIRHLVEDRLAWGLAIKLTSLDIR